MFGLGLGGFVQGFERGLSAREGLEDRRERRADRQERREERARERQNQEQIAGIGRAANEEIAGGANREDVESRYWRQIQDTYAAQGRPDLARQFQQWVRGDEAQRGVRHFQNGMVMFEMARRPDGTFDPEVMNRGLAELRSAQRLNAYGGDRQFDFRPIVEGEGDQARTIGYRVSFRGDDGKNVERDIAPGDIPRAAALLFNPQQAFEDRRQQDERRATERRQTATTERADWQKAEEQVRKEHEDRRSTEADAGPRSPGAPAPLKPWDELPEEERDRRIRERVQTRTPPSQRQPGLAGAGGPSAPAPRSGFDRLTGQPAGPTAPPAAPSAAARQAPPGLTTSVPAPTAGPGATSRSDDPAAAAQDALQRGESPDIVARGLRRAGIPLDQWPESLRAAVERRQQQMPAASSGIDAIMPRNSMMGLPR